MRRRSLRPVIRRVSTKISRESHQVPIQLLFWLMDMGVSQNGGTPKSSNLIGISIINHPFWGTPVFGNTHMNQKSDGKTSPPFLEFFQNSEEFSQDFPGRYPGVSRLCRGGNALKRKGVSPGEILRWIPTYPPTPWKLSLKDVLPSLIDMPSFFGKASVLVS